MNKKIKLTKAERIIFNSIMANFPATSKETAMDKAINGGANWQFLPK